MKKARLLTTLLTLFLATLLIIPTGCNDDDDDDDAINHFDVMTEYMQNNSMDLSDVLTGWITTAANVEANGVTNYYIIDLRAASDFNAGHIEGAHNTTLGNILTEAENATDPILVVCYTGQSAAHGVAALRLSGYSDAKSMKFGMSAWHTDFAGSWNNNTGDIADGHTNWSATNTIQTPVTFSAPEFDADGTTGSEILEERVEEVLANGFQAVTNSDVLDNPNNYFINNYWAVSDVDQYGHITSAYRIKEDLTIADAGFMNLDPDAPVVTYCWTGQTSSVITFYLNVLGYDAKSLKFGANGMIHSALQSHKWTTAAIQDFNYVQ